MAPNNDRRTIFLQHLNTVMISAILIFATFSFSLLMKLRNNQETMNINISVIKEQQRIQDKEIEADDARINNLEKNFSENIKSWVDQNYIRKPQNR